MLAGLMAAGLLATPAASNELPAALRAADTLLEVEATGTVRAVPDVAAFTVAVTSDGGTATDALRTNADTTTRLAEAARRLGVDDRAIRTEGLNVAPRYRERDGDRTDEIVGYRAITRLSIRVSPVASASAVLGALVAAGATDVDGPHFSFADPSVQTRAARRQAMVVAAAQATDYAAALNKKIARILRVSERRRTGGEGEDIIVTGARARSAPIIVPIEPGEQETAVTVWVDYAL